LPIATVHAAKGETAMRHKETYFEQVPIEVVETIIQQDSTPEEIRDKSPVPAPVPERRAVVQFRKPPKTIPTKGRS
jgi:hypothetical protein